MKPCLLIYSDCYIYGGSERLLATIILNPVIQAKYEIHFAYRRHPDYTRGIQEDYGIKPKNFHPLFILSNDTLFYKIHKSALPQSLQLICQLPFWLLQKAGIYFLYNYWVLRRLLRQIAPPVIHINNGGYPAAQSCQTMVRAAHAAKIPRVIYQVNNIAHKSKSKFSRWRDHQIEKSVHCFLTASRAARTALVENVGFAPEKIVAVPNTTLDKPVTLQREQILREFSLPASARLICEVGFLVNRKGQRYLIDALKIIASQDPALFTDLYVFLVGDGEDWVALKKYVRDNNLATKVILTGYRSDPINFINACDLFVLPSIANEDMPIAILEAMSKAKTIIATDFAGIQEELENGLSGILIPPHPETLAAAIATEIIRLNRQTIGVSYGQNAKARFDQFFSLASHGEQLVKIYQSPTN